MLSSGQKVEKSDTNFQRTFSSFPLIKSSLCRSTWFPQWVLLTRPFQLRLHVRCKFDKPFADVYVFSCAEVLPLHHWFIHFGVSMSSRLHCETILIHFKFHFFFFFPFIRSTFVRWAWYACQQMKFRTEISKVYIQNTHRLSSERI